MSNIVFIISILISIFSVIGMMSCAIFAINAYFYNKRKKHDAHQIKLERFILKFLVKNPKLITNNDFQKALQDASEEFHSDNN